MKKFLNGLGIFGSVILTILLTIILFVYVIILNIKMVVSENGMATALKRIDVVETLKSVENGTMWEDFVQLGENLNLTESQFEEILNSKEVKEQVGSYIGRVLETAFNDSKITLTKKELEDFLEVAITEYNKVSDTKISKEEKEEILSSIDDELIDNMNKEFGNINLLDEAPEEYVFYLELADNILFGSYSLIILVIMLALIGLIALFRFSYYKWISYTRVSLIITTVLMLALGVLLLVLPIDIEVYLLFKKAVIINVFITAAVLIIITILLTILKRILHKEELVVEGL